MSRIRQSQDKHIIDAYGVKALKAAHADVQKLKRHGKLPTIHGNKVWASCYAIMDYLQLYPLAENSRVLDVGCGWGVLAAWLAKQGADVVGVDADRHIGDYFALTAEINDVEMQFEHSSFEKITGSDLSTFNVLAGSDICFWDELTPVIFSLIERALSNGVTRVYIADPGRPPFWSLADQCAEAFYGTVETIELTEPRKSSKYLLVIHDD
ncbi:Ubiquinone biosynthesis O-methyltransferase [BD1-7 clade bacterium]|uniref:Ubiquinone biosynthesis O-methyltransferase n=1 Tax=BD1-7 clade bacterium TaxID=2029982 RepID=A0A5S9MUX6_9GAMM|nr:Ubiquinone biosynthesis O-methyltransferase [BD1-7 clade bacterium]CAA0083714.1 Ubiquinone biosynthesis O-methyltransferase [BD1-7 clade bacterium]